MKKPLIYVVEDDEGIREVYEGALEEDYDLRLFPDGAGFFAVFDTARPDLVILDIMLPDMDGYTILRRIREADERVPVIIVSAKSDEISFVKGLNKGADDYMSKPFSILELMARVRARLRVANLNISASGGFRIDRNTYKVFYDGTDLGLTLKEYRLLDQLISKAGVTVVGKPQATVMTSSPRLICRSPSSGAVRAEKAIRFAEEPLLTRCAYFTPIHAANSFSN